MLLRTIAILASVLAHGLVGYAIWPWLETEQTEVLDLGTGNTIELTPQGLIANEVTTVGDSVASLETQEVVPVEQRSSTQKPAVDAPTEPLRDVADHAAQEAPREVASLEEQKPTPKAPSASALQQLRDVPDKTAKDTSPEPAALDDQNPKPQAPVVTSTDPLANVDVEENRSTPTLEASPEQKPSLQTPVLSPSDQLQGLAAKEKSAAEQEIASVAQPPLPEPVPALKSSKAGDLPMPEQLHDQRDETSAVQETAVASQPVLPNPLDALKSAAASDVPQPKQIRDDVAPERSVKPLTSGRAGEFVPEVLRESTKVAKLNEPSPPEPVRSERPEERELVAQPEQVAIVTELSSGEEKSGGNAKILGIYMGKINAKVQRSKVNPRSQQTGSVLLRFTVGVDGSLLSKRVETSSGYQVLDDAALAAIDRAAPFPAVPKDVSVRPMTFTQVFRFVIR